MQLEQVVVLREHVNSSPYPTVIAGDFNTTQFSNVYRKTAEGFTDTFKEKGEHWGQTFSLKGIPLRIDYILVDDTFKVAFHNNYTHQYSDHYPVMAGLEFNE